MSTDTTYGGPSEDAAPTWDYDHNASFADIIQRLFRTFEATHTLNEIVEVARDAKSDLRDAPSGAQPELVERLAQQRLSER